MTKFADGDTGKDQALKAVIEAVKSGIKAVDLIPRIARFDYQESVWANVELFLLGCARGGAIVEDRYKSELNPNVALEWGWMKGMGKRVCFLAEEKFAHARADWTGLISRTFSWDAPATAREAVIEWLVLKEEV